MSTGTDTQQLLEQYKLYVASADTVTSRRGESNRFYTTVATALYGLLALAKDDSILSGMAAHLVILVSAIGMVLCIVWVNSLHAYKLLNSKKFQVLHEMEQGLPFRCFGREWELMGHGRDKSKYRRLTHVELYVPIVFFTVFLVIFVISVSKSSGVSWLAWLGGIFMLGLAAVSSRGLLMSSRAGERDTAPMSE